MSQCVPCVRVNVPRSDGVCVFGMPCHSVCAGVSCECECQ